MTTRETQEASRRVGRDSHGRHPHSSSRSRRDDPSPRRRRDDRRHDSDRVRYRSRDEESAKAADRDQKSNKDDAQHGDPLNAEAKNDPAARHERSPRGTKRLSESSEAWRPRSFFQHDERRSAGQGGRRYDRRSIDHARQRDQKEHLADKDKKKTDGHNLQGKVEQDQQQNDGETTWKHDGFFQMEEEAPLAKRRPPFQEMKMSLEQESAPTVTEPDPRSRKPDQPGPTSAIREERRSHHTRGFGNHRPFARPDDRSFKRGFPDRWSDDQRNGYDSRGRFAGRGGMDRDRFNPYGGRGNAYQASGNQEDKWKHDLYDQTNRSPTPKTEEDQIAKVEALLAL